MSTRRRVRIAKNGQGTCLIARKVKWAMKDYIPNSGGVVESRPFESVTMANPIPGGNGILSSDHVLDLQFDESGLLLSGGWLMAWS